VSHALIVALHANQPTAPVKTNVQAATQVSDLMEMEAVKLAIHHALPATTPGQLIHAHPVMKTPQCQPQDTVSVTSLRFDFHLATPVRTTVQVVLFSIHQQEHVKMIPNSGTTATLSPYLPRSTSIWTPNYQYSTPSLLTPTKLLTHSMPKAAIHLWPSARLVEVISMVMMLM
jgi:hypothetical protein